MDKLHLRRVGVFSCPVSEIIAMSAQLNHLDHRRKVSSEAARPISGQSHCWLNFIKVDYLWYLIFLYFSIILMQLWGIKIIWPMLISGRGIDNPPGAQLEPKALQIYCFPVNLDEFCSDVCLTFQFLWVLNVFKKVNPRGSHPPGDCSHWEIREQINHLPPLDCLL